MAKSSFTDALTVDAWLKELGDRLVYRRTEMRLTQAEVASHAGVAKRTVERAEKGLPIQTDTLFRLLWIFKALGELDNLMPIHDIRPSDILEMQRKREGLRRKRVYHRKPTEIEPTQWKWGDED